MPVNFEGANYECILNCLTIKWSVRTPTTAQEGCLFHKPEGL